MPREELDSMQKVSRSELVRKAAPSNEECILAEKVSRSEPVRNDDDEDCILVKKVSR